MTGELMFLIDSDSRVVIKTLYDGIIKGLKEGVLILPEHIKIKQKNKDGEWVNLN